MKNEKLYRETVDIILDAYNKKQLQAGDPCGCFIGNIVAKRMGVTKIYENGTPDYESHWYAGVISRLKHPNMHEAVYSLPDGTVGDMEEGVRQIELTGYTIDEVLFLEAVFEHAADTVRWDWNIDEDDDKTIEDKANLAGMKAALGLLAQMHETEEDESIERLEKIHGEVYAKDCALV